MVLLNKDVQNVEASAGVYRVDKDHNIFTFYSNDPALVYGGEGLLKKDFQAVHKGTSSLEETKKFVNAYGLNDVDAFKSSLRTVGVGTNIILHERKSGALVVPMVGRTQTGPDGTVGLGKQSRAAGGSFGDISASGYRELSEEFIFARDEKDNSVVVLNVVYEESSLNPREAQSIKNIKNEQALRILNAYDLRYDYVRFEDIEASVLHVPGLTQDITQNVDGERKVIQNRVLTDNASVGDFAGVDTILYVDLPGSLVLDSCFVKDGEENFDGDLLKREWSMKTPQEWCDLVKGGMPVSPAPKQVFDHWEKVDKALRL